MDEKIMTRHPDNSKAGVNISRKKYDTVRRAILSALRTRGPMTFTDLRNEVARTLAGNFEGSISWYSTTVKLDLEARKEIEDRKSVV